MAIHVAGNICIDLSFRLHRLPTPGETLNASALNEGLGGKGTNQAIAAARTGAPVTFWAPVGNDAAGARMKALLGAEIADLRWSHFDLPSDRSVIFIDANGENVIVTAASCAEAFDPMEKGALARTWECGDVLLMQGNLSAAVTATCLRQARAAGLTTIVNPSPLPATDLDFETVSLVIANCSEALSLTGETDAPAAAERLRAKGAAQVVITLGGAGALVHDGATSRLLPARSVDVCDTSGAGDCFAGTLAGLLHRGAPLVDAARLAIEAAGLSVGRPGTLSSFPSTAELLSFATQLELNLE